MLKKILITGGCGFIGGNLIRKLTGANVDVSIRVFDNLTVGKPEDLARVAEFEKAGAAESLEWKAGVTLVEGDIRDREKIANACRGADGVVHLAASTGVMPSIENPMEDCEANVIGTLNSLEAAHLSGAKRFVLASSGAPLGEQEPPIHEEMAPRPLSPYGASKLAGEAYCSAYFGSYGLETVCLRFGNVYGPYSSHKGSVVAKFIKHLMAGEDLPIYGDGAQTRDFIFVDDLTGAIINALEVPGVGGQVFQVATNKERTVGEVAESLIELSEKLLGKKARLVYEDRRKGEIVRNYSDITKARNILKWTPAVDLNDGLEITFRWFLDNAG